MSCSIETEAPGSTKQPAGLAGRLIMLLLAATVAVVNTSASHAYLSQLDRPEQIIQIGALESEAEAQERLSTARQLAQPLLDHAREYIEPVDKGPKRLYRARFAVDSDTVKAVCVTLKKANVSCVAISPTPTSATPIVATPASAPPGQPPSTAPQVRTTSPPRHRAEPPQPKSIWQAIKDSTKPGAKPN